MEQATIQELSAHAESVANRLGVHAGVTVEASEQGGLDPEESRRLILYVFRDAGGPRSQAYFSASSRDLKARIEQEIAVLAKEATTGS